MPIDSENSLFKENATESSPLINHSQEEITEVLETNAELIEIKLENAARVREKLIAILEKWENNTNSSIAWLVPVNTSTSIFPEFVSPLQRLSASATSALAASLANSLISVWENQNKNNTDTNKKVSFKSFIDFLKSPIGAPVCSYTMLLCFKTLGDFAPELPDNAPMLSVIGAIFAASLINGVMTHLGAKSDVNPLSKITRRDVANGMISGITAAGFIAQIDRMLRMNLDKETYETFGPYILPMEAVVGLVYGLARVIIPAIKFQQNLPNDRDTALSMMNTFKKNWDEINKHVRFIGNVIYISGLAIESTKLLNPNYAAAIISVVSTGPVAATAFDTIVRNYSSQQKISNLITSPGVNSPLFRNSQIQDTTKEPSDEKNLQSFV